MSLNITLRDIYQLFFNKKLVILSDNQPSSPKKNNNNNNNNNDNNILTPLSKMIYESTSPRSKEYILEELLDDDELNEISEIEADFLDPDFTEKMENNGLGFFMENIVSKYCICPECKKATLRKYSHSNVPVVDVVCTNHEYHLNNNKCFIYQVKISLNDEYFNFQNKYITVGSMTYGQIAHIHKGSEDIMSKIIIPGYICIRLQRSQNEMQTYSIDTKKSFVLIPDYNNNSNNYYYQYINYKNIYGKNILTWNNQMVKSISIKDIFKNKTISHQFFSEKEIDNPYHFLLNLV